MSRNRKRKIGTDAPLVHPESVPIKRLRKPGRVELETSRYEALSVEEEKIDFDTGSIEKIFLIDFMCHEKFIWELGPRINVLTGRNGSGKSSIIQAIVLGLGGNAKTTGRGYSSIANFVKSGQGKAVICIHLCNRGERSYKHETYGDKIIFKRVIYSIGSSEKIIMDQNEEPINTGRGASKERDKILDHMGIQLENPAVILQQEKAKTFFGPNWDPYQIYTMFSQSTMIQTTKDRYTEFGRKLESLCKKIEVLCSESENVVDDYKRKKVERDQNEREKLQCNEAVKKLFKRRQQLDIEDKTKKRDTKMNDKKRIDEAKRVERENLEEIDSEIKKVIIKQKDFNRRKVNGEQKMETAKNERLKAALEEHELRKDLRKKEMAHNRAKSRIREKLVMVNKAKAELNQSKTRAGQKAGEEKAKNLSLLKEELKKSEEEKKDSQKKKDEADQIFKNLKNNCDEVMCEINSINSELNRLSNEKTKCEGMRKKRSFNFGEDHARLAKEIEKTRWKIKPIGPIGKYVKVVESTKDPDTAAKALETFVGRALLSSYIVFENQDRYILSSIMSEVMTRKPNIYKMHNDVRPHNVENHRVRKSKDFECLIDMLEFEDDRVRNLIIDTNSIETSIYLNQQLAKKLFSDPSKVPPKATVGLTPDCYKFIPKTDRQSYASYFIGSPGNQARILRWGRCRDVLERDVSQIDYQISNLKRNQKDLENDKKKLSEKIENHRTIVRISQSNYEKCQESHNNLENQIEKLNESIKLQSGLQDALEVAEKEHEDAKEIAKNALTDRKTLEEKLNAKAREVQCLATKEKNLKEKIPKIPVEIDMSLTELNKKKKESETRISRLDIKFQKMVEEVNNLRSKLEETKSNMDQELEVDPEYAQLNRTQVISRLRELSKLSGDSKSLNIQQDVLVLKSLIDQGLVELKKLKKQKEELTEAYENRRAVFQCVFDNTCRAVRSSYNNLMSKIGLDVTTLGFDEKFKLEVNGKSPEALSGGEKSKTLICFVMALWCVQFSPFMCLDEWDVALDDDARQFIEKSLLNFARKRFFQHIFISPTKDGTGAGFLHDENMRKYVTSCEIKK